MPIEKLFMRSRFFSSEYQSFQCTTFNDHYLALLQSTAPGIPADRNISFDALNNPVSVNNAFFQHCGGNGKNCGPCRIDGVGIDGARRLGVRDPGGKTPRLVIRNGCVEQIVVPSSQAPAPSRCRYPRCSASGSRWDHLCTKARPCTR